MLGFFKARTRTAAPAAAPAATPVAKPSMKVAPKGKTTRSKVFKRDKEGNEHGKYTVVQDEDDNWYVERRKKGTGETQYSKLNIPGAATDLKFDPVSGKRMAGTEYDSKEQRLASYINRAGGTLRQESGDISRLAGDPFHHAGSKGTKVFGNKEYLPPVEYRNKKTVERDRADAPFKDAKWAGGPRIAPKKPGFDMYDHASRADLTRQINAYVGDYHKVKPKAPSGPKPGEGYDSFDAAVAKPHVKPKPAGTESAGSVVKPPKSPVIPVVEPETDTLAEKAAKEAVKKTTTKKSTKASSKPPGRPKKA